VQDLICLQRFLLVQTLDDYLHIAIDNYQDERMIDEFEGSLAKKRGEMANMNQGSGWYDNNSNLYPTYTEPDTSSYSIQLSYSDYWP
jgi:hypothetical protein